MSATATTGWKFTAWAGACKGSVPTCKLRLRGASNVAVTFVPPGARNNPYAEGQAVKIEGWQLTVNSASIKADDQVDALTDEFGQPVNDPPLPGAQYTLVNVSLAYVGGGSGNFDEFLLEHELDAEGANNAPYQENGCVPPPPDLNEVGDVFSGQTVTGNLCYEIASNDANSLMFSVYETSGTIWFALR